LLAVNSTELIQEYKAGEKHAERDPEMNVGEDGAKQIAGSVGLAQRHSSLGMEIAESGVPC
jgi:hypothetical protein